MRKDATPPDWPSHGWEAWECPLRELVVAVSAGDGVKRFRDNEWAGVFDQPGNVWFERPELGVERAQQGLLQRKEKVTKEELWGRLNTISAVANLRADGEDEFEVSDIVPPTASSGRDDEIEEASWRPLLGLSKYLARPEALGEFKTRPLVPSIHMITENASLKIQKGVSCF